MRVVECEAATTRLRDLRNEAREFDGRGARLVGGDRARHGDVNCRFSPVGRHVDDPALVVFFHDPVDLLAVARGDRGAQIGRGRGRGHTAAKHDRTVAVTPCGR